MNKQKIAIYGINLQAQQLQHFMKIDNKVDVVCFVVDKDYKKDDYLQDLPVVTYDDFKKTYPSSTIQIAFSFGYKKMMDNREMIVNECKKDGYQPYTYISDDSLVYSQDIGEGSIIYPGVIIAPFVKIGKGSFLEIGVKIAHNTQIGDYCFFGPGATVSGNTIIGNHCFFGINSTTFNNLRIADYSLIGAGVTIDRDTKEGESFKHSKEVALDKDSKHYL